MGCTASAHDVQPFSECAVTLSSDDGRGCDAAATPASPPAATITFTTSPWSEGNSTWTTPTTSGRGARPVSGPPHGEVAETATRVHDGGGNDDNDAALRSSSSSNSTTSTASATGVPALNDDDDIGENTLLPVSAASAVIGWATADDSRMSASSKNGKNNNNQGQNPLVAPMRDDDSATHLGAAQRASQRSPQLTAGAHVVAPLHATAEEETAAAPTTELEAEAAGWDPSSFGAMLFSDSGIADDRGGPHHNRPRTASASGLMEGSSTVLYSTREDAVLRRSPSVLTPTRSPVPSSILLGNRLLSADTLSRSPHGSRTNSNLLRSPRVLASPSGSLSMPQQQQHRGSSSSSIIAKRRRTTSASALLV